MGWTWSSARRDPRHHGSNGFGEEHAGQGPRGPPRLRGHRRLRDLPRPGHPGAGGDERSRAGIFLAFQYPVEIPGVSHRQLLRTAVQAHLPEGEELDLFDFRTSSWRRWAIAGDGPAFRGATRPTRASPAARRSATRSSRWRSLKPTLALMDETDSGLDIDALKIVANGVNKLLERIGDVRAPHHALPATPGLHQAHHVHVMVAGADRAVGRSGDSPWSSRPRATKSWRDIEGAEAASSTAKV